MLTQCALVALAATAVGAVKSLVIKGDSFVDPDTGDKFQVVGMAYQPGGSAGFDPKTGKDPLADPDACLRDAALMQALGINTIRVYNLDPDGDHDECASIFNAAGMYMALDVNGPLVGESIASYQPWTTYYAAYLNHTFAVVEAFANYPNTLLYFSGNEIINNIPSAQYAPQYIRAVTRDLKNYIKNNIERQIPVGYSAADVRNVLFDTFHYLECAEDGDSDNMSMADLFALNSYSWCGPTATYESSTYDQLVSGFKDTPIPVFFSEYGCIKPAPRYWNETKAIYGPEMTPTMSGGIVYEWTNEANGYGLTSLDDNSTQILGDYYRLKDQFSKLDWKSIQSQSPSKTTSSPPACDAKLITVKGFDNNFTLPDVPPGGQKLIDHGISPKPSGKLVNISSWDVTLEVKDQDKNTVTGLKVVPLPDNEFNWYGKNQVDTGGSGNSSDSGNSTSSGSGGDDGDDGSGAAALMQPLVWAVALPLAAMFLF